MNYIINNINIKNILINQTLGEVNLIKGQKGSVIRLFFLILF